MTYLEELEADKESESVPEVLLELSYWEGEKHTAQYICIYIYILIYIKKQHFINHSFDRLMGQFTQITQIQCRWFGLHLDACLGSLFPCQHSGGERNLICFHSVCVTLDNSSMFTKVRAQSTSSFVSSYQIHTSRKQKNAVPLMTCLPQTCWQPATKTVLLSPISSFIMTVLGWTLT